MHGKAVLAAVTAALVAVAVWSSACSAPPATARGSEQVRTCFGTTPRDWAAALDSRTVDLPNGTTFGLTALAGDAVFGQFDSARRKGVGELNLRTGRLTTIASFPRAAGGLGAMAVDLPWVVWEQLDSSTDVSDWSVHAWNERTGTASTLATSTLGNGSHVLGQQPIPVIDHGVVAWAQPASGIPGHTEAQLRTVDLTTGRSRVLAAGTISSPVYAGRYLIWAQITGAGAGASFAAVDAHTQAAVQLPPQLRTPGSIGYLAGSPQYLAWSAGDGTSMKVWRIGSQRYRQFTQDGRHQFQFLQMAGHYVLWYNGVASSVLDVTTGKGFDVNGSVTGSEAWIATSEPVSRSGRGDSATSGVSAVAAPSAPRIAACASR